MQAKRGAAAAAPAAPAANVSPPGAPAPALLSYSPAPAAAGGAVGPAGLSAEAEAALQVSGRGAPCDGAGPEPPAVGRQAFKPLLSVALRALVQARPVRDPPAC